MSIILAANTAESQLAAGISAVALTAQLTPGTGVLFPAPTAGQYFKLTFLDAASTQLREIVHVTNVTGDTITMVRGQEGTTAKPYLAGDIATELFTAGSFQALVQAEQLQNRAYSKASTVGGTGDAITATLPSTLTAVPNGLALLIPAGAANTGATTLALTLGSTLQTTVPIVKGANVALAAGDIPGAGFPMNLVYSSTYAAYVLTNLGGAGFLSNAMGVYNPDASGAGRIFFGTGGPTKVRGYGSTAHQWTNAGDVLIASMTSTGLLSTGADAASPGDVPRFGQVQALAGKIQSITATVAANALTLGSAATALDFRNATLANGAPNSGVAVGALSLVVPSTATLGTVSGQSARLVLLVAYNAGTPVLCVVNLAGGVNLDETTLISPTTISTGATSATVIYSASSVAAGSPFRVIGFTDISEATAGTWATAPTLVQGIGGQSLGAMATAGFGQTWQDVNASRSLGTTYTNLTGRTISVIVGFSYNATVTYLYIDGAIRQAAGSGAGGISGEAGFSFQVKPGSTYQIAGASKNYWSELR